MNEGAIAQANEALFGVDKSGPKYKLRFKSTPSEVLITASDSNFPKYEKKCKTPCTMTIRVTPDMFFTATSEGYLTQTTKAIATKHGGIDNKPFFLSKWGSTMAGRNIIRVVLVTPEEQARKDEYDTILKSTNTIDCAKALLYPNLEGRSLDVKPAQPKISHRMRLGRSECRLNYKLTSNGKVRDITAQDCINSVFTVASKHALAKSIISLDNKKLKPRPVCGLSKKFTFNIAK